MIGTNNIMIKLPKNLSKPDKTPKALCLQGFCFMFTPKYNCTGSLRGSSRYEAKGPILGCPQPSIEIKTEVVKHPEFLLKKYLCKGFS